jgi:hypothetical protein
MKIMKYNENLKICAAPYLPAKAKSSALRAAAYGWRQPAGASVMAERKAGAGQQRSSKGYLCNGGISQLWRHQHQRHQLAKYRQLAETSKWPLGENKGKRSA